MWVEWHTVCFAEHLIGAWVRGAAKRCTVYLMSCPGDYSVQGALATGHHSLKRADGIFSLLVTSDWTLFLFLNCARISYGLDDLSVSVIISPTAMRRRQCRENSRLALEPLSAKLVEKIHEKKGECWVCLLKSEAVATLKVFSRRRKEKKNNWQLKNKSHSENIGEDIV